MKTCPSCIGFGRVTAILDPGGRVSQVTCPDCQGAKQVSEETLFYMKLGKQMRAGRLKAGQSQGEAAERLGMDRVALSQLENGRGFQWRQQIPLLVSLFTPETYQDFRAAMEADNETAVTAGDSAGAFALTNHLINVNVAWSKKVMQP